MRVIAGSAGGMTLFTPRDESIRPCCDRTRQAIFSSLGDVVPGARVLDIFAGTGSIGLEALSRGAARGVFIEKNRPALKLLERNIAKTGLTAEVLVSDAVAGLSRLAQRGDQFDLIFADPPFWKDTDKKQNIGSNRELRQYSIELLANADLRQILAPGGTFVLDSYDLDHFEVPPEWTLLREKIYGQVRVQFLVPAKA